MKAFKIQYQCADWKDEIVIAQDVKEAYDKINYDKRCFISCIYFLDYEVILDSENA